MSQGLTHGEYTRAIRDGINPFPKPKAEEKPKPKRKKKD